MKAKDVAIAILAGGMGLLNVYLLLEGQTILVGVIDFTFDMSVKLSTGWAKRI